MSDLSIRETQTILMNRESFPCKNYVINTQQHNQNPEFVDCCITNLWFNLQSRVNCSVPGLSAIFQSAAANSNIVECTDLSAASNTRKQTILELFKLWASPTAYGCLIPCNTISYSFNLLYYHENGIMDDFLVTEKGSFVLYLYYDTLMSEERSETLLYDVPGFLAAAGGNLGLMLGFSCLTVLFSILNYFEKVVIN